MSEFAGRLSGLDALIEAEMQKWHVPGLAVAVLHDGEIIHERGYGTRDADNPQPVTPETLFAIGSCTKAFTVMGLGLLVDDGRLDWDRPVRHYMPQFRLYDPAASEQMTARDLVCHRSGLPRHDAMWYGSSQSRWELLAGLPHIKPSYPFRYIYQYQNLMYMAAGCLIETISGQTWEQFTQERIFDALGMKDSVFSVTDAAAAPNAAWPHEVKDGTARRIPFLNIDAVGPAGSIHSSLRDMQPWLKLHLNGGQHAGQPFIAADNLRQMHQAHVVAPPVPPMNFPENQQVTYGLGWAQAIYRGHLRIRHTGGIDGFISDVSFMPQHKLGVMVFNNGGDSLSHCIAMHIYDCLLGLETIDWRERYKAAEDIMKADMEAQQEKLRAARKPDTAPSHPLEAYAGEYTHPGYGTLTIRLEDSALYAEFYIHRLRLTHLHYDTFETQREPDDVDRPLTPPIMFRLNVAGDITEAAIQLEPAVEAIVFART
jgi:CubicO group peptidase (beta-lactamase class C family)